MKFISDLQKRVIRELQGDVEVRADFFEAMAPRLGVTLEQLLECIRGLKEKGVLKRIGAVVRHQRLGYAHNFLMALRIPAARVEESGRKLALKPFVSHCYERSVPPEFPFNLFAMVHATSKEEAEAMVQEIREEAEAEDFQVLKSVREVKKESMKFF